jgi:hypothetical protein
LEATGALAKLFRGLNKHPLRLLPVEINPELELMQVLAEVDGDECPDDGRTGTSSEVARR